MKRRHRSLVVLVFALSSAAVAAVSQTGPAAASFTGKGPAGFKLEGKSDQVIVKTEGTRVMVTVPLAKLDTGIDLRNRHMREKYLETDKYPNATLVVDRSSIKLPAEGASVQGTGTGEMTLHGKTKPVSFQYVIRRESGVYLAEGKVPLNIKDFDIFIPSYLGVTVKPEIETAVTFRFTE